MLQTSARLLRLVTVLQAKRTWTGPELADRLEVTSRTLRRDVDRLRTLGYPVHSTSGTAGGYSLGAGASLPPLMLEDDEGVAVAVALTLAAGGSKGSIESAALRALTKLEQVLPLKLQRRVKSVRGSILKLADRGPKVELARVSELAEACSEQVLLSFRYQDRKGTPSARTVEPLRVAHVERRWYLVAWDRERQDWRTFRVDRIEGALTRGERFAPRPAPEDDIGAYVRRSISGGPVKHEGTFVLHAPLEKVREKVFPGWGKLEPIDAKRTRFITGGNEPRSIVLWVAMFGFDFEVEGPAVLREAAAACATQLARGAKDLVRA